MPESSTADLSVGFNRVMARLSAMGVAPDRAAEIERSLQMWAAQLARAGLDLPSPAVFRNEHGEVELEWDHCDKSLLARLVPNGLFEIVHLENEVEQNATITAVQMVGELLWLLG